MNPKNLVVGTAIGAACGFGISLLVSQRGKKGGKNGNKDPLAGLGYDWPNARQDPVLVAALKNLRAFSHADEESYRRIGVVCDNMLSLYFLVSDPKIPIDSHWSFKAFQYKTHAENKLTELSLAINNLPVEMIRDRMGHHRANRHKKTNMEEYFRCADELIDIIRSYQQNIMRKLGEEITRSRAAAPPPSNPKDGLSQTQPSA